MISLIQQFEADFLWKVSLKILNSGIILKTFTHVNMLTVSAKAPVTIIFHSTNFVKLVSHWDASNLRLFRN